MGQAFDKDNKQKVGKGGRGDFSVKRSYFRLFAGRYYCLLLPGAFLQFEKSGL